jgi:hypothetical protein
MAARAETRWRYPGAAAAVMREWHSLLDEPYPLLLRISLVLALLGGFGLGLVLLLSFVLRMGLPLGVGALIQAHGQVQTLGFVTLFIMAVATRLLPRFHGADLEHGSLVSLGGLLLATGVVLRAVGQPLPPTSGRSVVLVLSGLLTLGGVLLAVAVFGGTVRRGTSPRQGEPLFLPLTMASSLIGFLLLNVVASIGLASGGITVPAALDEALIHLELWGFASTMVLAIASHTWPTMLLLHPSRVGATHVGLALWAFGSIGTPVAWLAFPDSPAVRAIPAASQLAGALFYVYALRLFESPERGSLIPLVTDQGRAWVRAAFGFLLVAATINVVVALTSVVGSAESVTALSAARHALAQGFLLPVIVFMSARILPGYSPRMMAHPERLAGLMVALLLGALLRAGGELIGGYAEGWDLVLALGGTVTTLAFVVFAVELWQTTARTVLREGAG